MSWIYGLLIGCLAVIMLLSGPFLFGRLYLPKVSLNIIRALYRLMGRLLIKTGPVLDLSLVRAGNKYFRKAFAATSYQNRLFFLPLCLRPLNCPAHLDPSLGYLCQEICPGCELGQIRQEALELGYKAVYIVPSSRMIKKEGIIPSDQFMLAKIKEHAPSAVLGVICPWYFRHRLLAKYTIGSSGYSIDSRGTKSVIQGVLLKKMNCRKAEVDWEQVRACMSARSQ